MGFSISDIGSAISDAAGDVAGAVSKIPDPIAMAIEAGGNAIGLDPKITGMIEVGVGFCTGDVMCGIHGANDVLNSKASSSSGSDVHGAQTPTQGYARADVHAAHPCAPQGVHGAEAPPPAIYHSSSPVTGTTPPPSNGAPSSNETYASAMQTISNNFDLLDTAAGVGNRDGQIGKSDLQAALNNPNVPADVKAACKFLLDNPAYFNEADASGNGNRNGLLSRGDVNAAIAGANGAQSPSGTSSTASTSAAPPNNRFSTERHHHHAHQKSEYPPPTYGASSTSGTQASSSSTSSDSSETYAAAMQTLNNNFDLLDTAGGIGNRDGEIGKADLQAALNNPDIPADVKAACKFLLDNPAYYNEADAAGSGVRNHLIGRDDVAAAVSQSQSQGSVTGSTSTASTGTTSASSAPPASTAPASGSSASSTATNAGNPSVNVDSSPATLSAGSTDGTMDGTLNSLAANAQGQLDSLQQELSMPNLSTQQLDQIQDKMQQVQQMMTMITNMQKDMHDTQMSIINNLR